jgi:hypothetical protein
MLRTNDNGMRIRRKGKLIIVKSREKNHDQLKEKRKRKTATTMSNATMNGETLGEACSDVAATTVEVGSDDSDILLRRGCGVDGELCEVVQGGRITSLRIWKGDRG